MSRNLADVLELSGDLIARWSGAEPEPPSNGREIDPQTGLPVRPARRPRPWFKPTKQNHDIHNGRIDTTVPRQS